MFSRILFPQCSGLMLVVRENLCARFRRWKWPIASWVWGVRVGRIRYNYVSCMVSWICWLPLLAWTSNWASTASTICCISFSSSSDAWSWYVFMPLTNRTSLFCINHPCNWSWTIGGVERWIRFPVHFHRFQFILISFSLPLLSLTLYIHISLNGPCPLHFRPSTRHSSCYRWTV